MTEPTGKLPAPPANEEAAAILEDFKALLRQTTGAEYAKQILFPAVPNNREGTTFKNVTTEASWRMYWLGRMGVVSMSASPANGAAVAIDGRVPPVTARVNLQLPGLVNGIIRRLKARPGRYCLTSVALLARGALFFVDVDADGTVHQLTPHGERDGALSDAGWRGDEFTLDPRLIEEFPGGAPEFAGNPRGHVICLCPDCTAPKPRPAVRSTRTYVELGLSQPAYDEIHAKLREAGYGHAFGAEGEINLHGLAAVLDPEAEPRTTVTIDATAPKTSLPLAVHNLRTVWNELDLSAKKPAAIAWGLRMAKALDELQLAARGEASRGQKCDGNHGGPACADPECWSRE